MFHETLKSYFKTAVDQTVSKISQFANDPGRDFSRKRKITPDLLISFLVSQGASSTEVELLDFFGLSADLPSASALNQQRSKLSPDALESVLKNFNSQAAVLSSPAPYRYLAADGSTFTFFSKHSFASEEYFVSEGHSAKGFYSVHMNALYDLDTHIYPDALIQAIHHKDEFQAFCQMVDRLDISPGVRNVFIGDRGYCSYNNMAHVIERGQYFLFRTKDIHSKGLVRNFDFPDAESFDITVSVSLVRSHSTKIHTNGQYRRFIGKAASFDFIEYGTNGIYDLTFRIVRFPLSDSSYECVVTNLPENEFPMEELKTAYHRRWGIESSFRKLKYTIGLSKFHSYKPAFIKQEIWAKLIAYNITELLVSHTVVEKHGTKHTYKVNFAAAAFICRTFLRLTTKIVQTDVMELLRRKLIPVRDNRQYPRLNTAHFRRPGYFLYRAA